LLCFKSQEVETRFDAAHALMAELAAGVEQAADAAAIEKAGPELECLREECQRVSRELERERAKPPV